MTRIYLFLQLSLCLFAFLLSPRVVRAQNRTFSLVAINPNVAVINGKDVVRASNDNPSAIGVGFPNPGSLTVFLYKQTMYMKCSSSPTRLCIGYFQKNFGGALTGWNFQFWPNENFPTANPIGSYAGRFGIQNIGGVDLLVEGVDANTGLNGSPVFQLCTYPNISNSPFAYTPAVTNANCIWGTQFKVLYSDAHTCG